MKKVTSLLLIFILIIGVLPVVAATKREVWVSSPGITCGLTEDEIMFNKAVHLGAARLYKLDAVGDRYYLGVLEEQVTDGGSNGKKKTSYLTYYSVFETDDSFLILGKTGVNNEYYWDGLEGVRNISGYIDTEYYTDKGYEAPYYIINPHNKYTYSQWDEYIDYIFIGSNGGIARISDWCDYGQARFPMIYENKLYTGQNAYYSNERSYKYYLSDGTTPATQRRIIGIKNNAIVNVASPASVAATDITSANGYRTYGDGMSGDTNIEQFYAFPGNEGKYYKYKYVLKNGVYECVLSIYENVIGHMEMVQEETCSTGLTTKPTVTPYTISGLDESRYISVGVSVPVLRLGEIFVLKNGKMMRFESDSSYNGFELCVYNNRLATIRNYANGEYIYYRDSNGSYRYWQRINYLNFTSDGITIEEDIDLTVGTSTGLDGYYSNYYTFSGCSKVVTSNYAPLKVWWSHCLDNKFSDGRYVSGHWTGMGNSMYEIWYDIYDKDGMLVTTGASDFSTVASSALYTLPIRAFVINDTKILLCLSTLSNSWVNEYYRVAVVNENDDGIIEVPQPLGKKNLVVPEDTDTEPVNSVVDFAAEDLELGFNIKENIIGTDKLTSVLREQVNSIYLNDITVVAKEGSVRGRWTIGFSLPTYHKNDYSFGEEPIYFYTNGKTLNWSCANPENLTPGTYEQMLYIDGKSFYITVKVIKPPSNDSASIVVF